MVVIEFYRESVIWMYALDGTEASEWARLVVVGQTEEGSMEGISSSRAHRDGCFSCISIFHFFTSMLCFWDIIYNCIYQ